ncbi:WD40 repeat domain-containing protein, partial [Bacteroidota bacterium]
MTIIISIGKIILLSCALVWFAVPTQAQEHLPDTVWSKQIQNAQVVKFSPNGQYVFVGIDKIGSSVVYKIETTTGTTVDTFRYHRPLTKRLSFSPTGDTLAVSGSGFIRLWDIRASDTIFTFEYGEEACITPDGKRIIATTGKMGVDEPQILVIDIETKEIIKSFIGRYNGASNLQVSNDGKYFSFEDFRGTYGTVIL